MSTATPSQLLARRALADVSAAVRRFSTGGAVEAGEIAALLPAWRVLQPRSHAGAGDDALDLVTVARVTSLQIWRQSHAVCQSAGLRGALRMRSDVHDTIMMPHAADALAALLCAALEQAKRAHGFAAAREALPRAFDTPAAAQLALAALDDAVARDQQRSLAIAPPTLAWPSFGALTPTYLVVGAGAVRMHDVLSPYARRLGPRLMGLARTQAGVGGARGGDDLAYAAIEVLHATHPDTLVERLSAEAGDGFYADDVGIIVDCQALPPTGADGRAAAHLERLRRARARVVLLPNGQHVQQALDHIAPALQAVVVLSTATSDVVPAFVADAATGVTLPVANALSGARDTLHSVDAIALAPNDCAAVLGLSAVDADAFGTVSALFRAHSGGSCDAPIAVRAMRHVDTAAVLEMLSRMGKVTPTPTRGRRAPR